MQPKEINTRHEWIVFFLSPRQIVRSAVTVSINVPYCEHFNIQNKYEYTQIEDSSGNIKTHIKASYKLNITKPIKFI